MAMLEDDINKRIGDLTEWLQEQAHDCFKCQDHLETGSNERIYWHYGYLMALKDVQKKQLN